MLVYVSNGKASPVVKAPGKTHSGTMMKKPFACFKHKKERHITKTIFTVQVKNCKLGFCRMLDKAHETLVSYNWKSTLHCLKTFPPTT